MAQAILNFDEIDDQNVRSLQRIDIMSDSLLAGDVLAAVFRNMLVVSPMQTKADDATQLKSTPSSNDQWYEIDAVLKRRKRRTETYISSNGKEVAKLLGCRVEICRTPQSLSTSATTPQDVDIENVIKGRERRSENLHCTVHLFNL
jgi:antitoxin (DNA-binding transcriptional repressor) of toxin-antitoxin stability system